jgi:putative transposase
MSCQVSPSTDRVYGLQRVTRLWGVARATIYRHRHRADAAQRRKPGPQGAMSDEDLAGEIRQLLQTSPFHGEGYRKLWARLRFAQYRLVKPCHEQWRPFSASVPHVTATGKLP